MDLNFRKWRERTKSKPWKLKTKLRNRQVIIGALSICLGIVTLSFLGVRDLGTSHISSFLPSQELALKSSAINFDFSDFNNVEKHEVPNAKATVIYVPQIHKDPTTGPQDPKNDQAVGIQKEISQMLGKLVDNHNISYIMDETDLYGPMPSDKIAKVKQGYQNIADARNSIDKLLKDYVADGGSQSTADQIKAASEQKIVAYERNINLTGGAAVLAATNSKAHVYGSQNAATLTEATKQLQNIVYMENRMSQLQSQQNPQTASTAGASGNSSASSILAMLGGGSSSSNVSLAPVQQLAASKQDQNLKDDLQDVNSKFGKLSTSASFETSSNTTTPAANANQNPYQNETNLQKLTQEHDQAVTEFMKVAKDQRSQEAADNVVKMIQTNGQKSGVLVMGQQHQQQLIDDLNKQGVSVIVITPDSEVGVVAQ